jgi:serine protease Do
MIRKIQLALVLLALALPGSFALALPGPEDEQPQINGGHEGWFFAAGGSYLGVVIQDVTADRMSALKLKEERGVEVTVVDQDAPASKAGLKEHDVILDYNGTRVESEEQLRRMIRETPAGRTITLGISRDGAPMSLHVQLGDHAKVAADHAHKLTHENFELMIPRMQEFSIEMPGSPVLGIQIDPVGHQLGEYFGVKNGEGLLVRSVEKGSIAEKAGLKAGDVITRADSEKIAERSDLRKALRARKEGGKVALGIVRDKHEQTLTVDLPARKSREGSSLEFNIPQKQIMDEIHARLQEMKPFINQQIQDNMRDLKPKMMKISAEIRPEIAEAMRRARAEIERASQELKAHQKDLKDLKIRIGTGRMI